MKLYLIALLSVLLSTALALAEEIPRGGCAAGALRNDDVVAVTLGEPYAGPGSGAAGSGAACTSSATGIPAWGR